MNRITTIAAAAVLALLAGCGDDSERGGVTAEEENQLNSADAMLTDNMIDVSPDSMVANEAELEAMDAAAGLNGDSAEENRQ